jgi:hypothetical protein
MKRVVRQGGLRQSPLLLYLDIEKVSNFTIGDLFSLDPGIEAVESFENLSMRLFVLGFVLFEDGHLDDLTEELLSLMPALGLTQDPCQLSHLEGVLVLKQFIEQGLNVTLLEIPRLSDHLRSNLPSRCLSFATSALGVHQRT